MSDRSQFGKAIQEFLSEAQDIIESLGKTLMSIDSALKKGAPDPDLVNDLFRGMHTLKSLCGMFDIASLAKLAHTEESLLEEIRLGRIPLRQSVLDLLFESLELITSALFEIAESGNEGIVDDSADIEALENRIKKMLAGEELSPKKGGKGASKNQVISFDPEILEVLTEYEEFRLKTNLNRQTPFLKIKTSFNLDSIDVDLENMKNRLKPMGEIITYLPSSEETEAEKLAIDIIMALHGSMEDLRKTLEGANAVIEEIKPKTSSPEERDTDETEKQEKDIESAFLPLAAPKTAIVLDRAQDHSINLRSLSHTVRVDIRKLDKLMNVIGELAIVRGAIGRLSAEMLRTAGRSDLAIEIHRVNRGLERKLQELREGILEVRMVPLSQMFDRLNRAVRKLSKSLGKEVHMVVSGEDTEVDKLIIEELSDPMMHVIRNAIDHGIEDAVERKASGKPEIGTVALNAYQKGNHVVIEVEDDGAGIDGERVLEVALERGITKKEETAELSQDEIINFIFLPGFSTADSTTEISGRGVGLDVVKTNISALGGVVEVQSETGIGTKVSITLPSTLAIIPTLLIEVSENTYAVPLNTVTEAILISRGDIIPVLGMDTISLRGETLALCRLNDLFGFGAKGKPSEQVRVLVASLGQRRLGLVVDSLIGQQDVVIKPLGETLKEATFFSGAADIGDNKLALVLDTGALIDEFIFSGSKELQGFVQEAR